jgi:N-acetylglutamate synthase-like GNAT family acetyltransferase
MKSGEITRRPAAKSDWRAIAALLDEGGLPLQGARENLAEYLVATTGKSIVGCAGMERYGDIALLRSVAVAPLMAHRGIGSALVDGIIQEARQRNVRKLFLLTLDMHGYFSRFGFVHEPMERAPAALQASAEFQGACPKTATLMARDLAGR